MTDVDDLTVHWEEDGEVRVHERDKCIIQRGSWATILYRYDERDRKTGEMHGPKFAIRRYRKRGDAYQVHSKLVLTSAEQARAVAEQLLQWTDPSTNA